MKLEVLFKIANALANNRLGVTRYGDHWDVHSYDKKLSEGDTHKAEETGIRKALVKFIETFSVEIKKA